jgi:Ca-activated chloride channel family protein
MDFERDYYAVLGVQADTDAQTIKQAYRQLARRYHPDTSNVQGAAERFLEIQEAYELLTDPVQRTVYDRWRREQGADVLLPIIMRITPSHQVLHCLGEAQMLYVLVEISASEQVENQRLPLNISLVLDRSTSMKGTRLQRVKDAARYIVDQMGPEDVLSLVAFSDRAELILPGSKRIQKRAARAAIGGIRANGGTEILQGLKTGMQEVQKWHGENRISHLILLTDGQTYGDEVGCLKVSEQAGEQGITLTTMGIGSDWNDQILDEMARRSGAPGGSIYLDSSAKIAKAFAERIQSLGQIFARNLCLSINLGKDVSVEEIFRVCPQMDRLTLNDNRMSLGMLATGEPQAVMLSLLVGCYKPGRHRMLQVDLEAEVPSVEPRFVRTRQTLTLSFDTNIQARSPISPDIVSAMGKLAILKMQERAMQEIEAGQIEAAISRLKTMATRLLDIGEAELARAALLEAGHLGKSGTLSSEGRKKLRYGTRELTILPKEVRHG